MGINVVKCGGEFFVGTQTMHRKAFCVVQDLWPVYLATAYSGENKKIPTVSGRKRRRRRLDQAEYQLEMVMVGDVLFDDSLPATAEEGFEINLAWLEGNVWGIPGGTTSSRAVHILTPRGITKAGDAQFGPPTLGERGAGHDMHGTWTFGAKLTLPMTLAAGILV